MRPSAAPPRRVASALPALPALPALRALLLPSLLLHLFAPSANAQSEAARAAVASHNAARRSQEKAMVALVFALFGCFMLSIAVSASKWIVDAVRRSRRSRSSLGSSRAGGTLTSFWFWFVIVFGVQEAVSIGFGVYGFAASTALLLLVILLADLHYLCCGCPGGPAQAKAGSSGEEVSSVCWRERGSLLLAIPAGRTRVAGGKERGARLGADPHACFNPRTRHVAHVRACTPTHTRTHMITNRYTTHPALRQTLETGVGGGGGARAHDGFNPRTRYSMNTRACARTIDQPPNGYPPSLSPSLAPNSVHIYTHAHT